MAEAFRTSHTPIREAFRRLEQEGLINRMPQGGMRVPPLSERTLKEILNVRLVLEGYAAELAAKNITQQEIEQLKRINDQAEIYLSCTESFSKEDIRYLWELNVLFHDTIINSTRNDLLIKVLSHLREISQRYRIISHFGEEDRKKSWQEHKSMLNYLKKKDQAALKLIWQKHLKHAASAALRRLTSLKYNSDND